MDDDQDGEPGARPEPGQHVPAVGTRLAQPLAYVVVGDPEADHRVPDHDGHQHEDRHHQPEQEHDGLVGHRALAGGERRQAVGGQLHQPLPGEREHQPDRPGHHDVAAGSVRRHRGHRTIVTSPLIPFA